jgi:CRP-like cAMP-binding protein
LSVVGPGEGFGEGALLAPDSRRTASAVALEATETRSITRDEFERLRDANPRIEQFLTNLLAGQVRRLSAHLLEALYVPVESRVLRRLLMLAESYATTDGTIEVPITQDDLATMAGTTRPTANRVLKAAEDERLVRVGRGRVEILDLEALARRAY